MVHEPKAEHHVQDATEGTWELFDRAFGHPVELHLPKIFGFQITKFMVLELIAAALILIIFIPLARRARDGTLPKGAWWNAFEVLLTFIRNDVARPTLGAKEADKYVPFLWTLFLFILFCNLLGLFPFAGSPTASIWMTGGLALIAFVMFHGAAAVKMGPWAYVKSLWTHFELVPNPWHPEGTGHGHGHGHDAHGHAAKEAAHSHEPARQPTTKEVVIWYAATGFSLVLTGMIFLIELMGTFIKAGVLAVRLFANMFAGHMVLATILLFIFAVGKNGFTALWPVVTFASVVGVVALSLLELFVAFLQAYIFVFLTSLFMGMALNPQH
jgi:F-type H+-transporting ATPase subunit a